MGVSAKRCRIFVYKNIKFIWWVGACMRYPIPFKEPLMVVTTKDVALIVQWAVDGRNAVPLTDRK